MIYVAKQANVDVINMSIGGLPALNDGNNTRAVLYDRLIEQYNVQMFISAGNSGPGMNTIGDPSVATKVISVGAYITERHVAGQLRLGRRRFADNLHTFSSRGPREDGGFKPKIVAPGAAVSTTPLWQAGGPVRAPTRCRRATRCSTARRWPRRRRRARRRCCQRGQASRRAAPAGAAPPGDELVGPLHSMPSRIGAYEQGNGLIRCRRGLGPAKTNIKTVEITSSVPVDTVLDEFLATPGIGDGHLRPRGRDAGQQRTRGPTPSSGPRAAAEATTYNLSWVGNDGTFSSPASSRLPANTPVDVRRSAINPATAGAHSAILNLDDPSTAGIDYQTMNVVVAARSVHRGRRLLGHARPARSAGPQQTSYFFNVPAGTSGVQGRLQRPSATPGTGQARFLRFHPYGVGIDRMQSSLIATTPAAPAACSTGSPLSRTTTNPQAGVWEVTVEARRTSDAENAPFTLTASILGATVSPNPDVIAVGDDRRAGRAQLHADQPVRRVHRPGGRHDAGQRVARHADDRQPGTAAVPGGRHGGIDVAPRDDRQPVRPGGRPRPVRVQLHDGIVRPGRPIGGRRLGGVGDDQRPAAGTWVVLVDGFAVPAGDDVQLCRRVHQPGFGTCRSPTRTRCARPGPRGRCPALSPPTPRRPPAGCCSATSRSAPTRTCWSAPATSWSRR